MKTILHIFAKDARHLWIQILISLGLTTGLVLTFPIQWVANEAFRQSTALLAPAHNFHLLSLSGALVVLVPLNWCLLISPVIHAERLVGNRQVWLTRPYEWKELLAAKVLFLIVFLYLPSLLAECLLLAEAGFQPLHYLPGLLYNMLLISAVVVLPLAALSTVTNSFGSMTVAVLAVVTCLIGILTVGARIPADSIDYAYGSRMYLVLAIAGCIAVVLLQYARRDLRTSWLVFLGTIVLLGIVALGAPDQMLMGLRYPVADSQNSSVVWLSYYSQPGYEPYTFVSRYHNQVGISIPIHISGIPQGTLITAKNLKVALEAADGSRWTSVWQPLEADRFMPGDNWARTTFSMPLSVYEKLKAKPLQVHLTFALAQEREGETARISIPVQDFKVPGFGICTPVVGFSERPDEISGITCRAALHQPDLTLIQAAWLNDRCDVSVTEQPQMERGEAWVGAAPVDPASLIIAPVWSSTVPLSHTRATQMVIYSSMTDKSTQQAKVSRHVMEPSHLCPGSPITFTRYSLSQRMQATFDIQDFKLPELSHGLAAVIENP